jgi:sigma-54 dependent transcriptional regulator, acetoin dehydrogenase operon transcriptional activator AcoR
MIEVARFRYAIVARDMGPPDATVSLGESSSVDGEGDLEDVLSLLLRSDQPLAASGRFPISGSDGVVLGRGETLAVQRRRDAQGDQLLLSIPDRHMSTTHARLLRLPGGHWLLEDAGSKNGTVVNGARCTRAPLEGGDLLEVGRSFLLYHRRRGTRDTTALAGLTTASPELAESYAGLARVAPSLLSIVLLGETGVGKEIVARAVHQASGRAGAFVAVNCGAIPANLVESTLFGHRRGAFSGAAESRPGLVRSADRGTLFLDEIGELPGPAQAALLRVLQEREVVPVGETRPIPVDLRVVAATHRDLRAGIEAGTFREDLFARLSGLVVRIPPVRERREDLGTLIAAVLRRVAREPEAVRFTPRAARALLRHDWPRNVRELETCLMAATLLAPEGEDVDVRHLSEEVRDGLLTASKAAEEAVPAEETPALKRELSAAELATLLKGHNGNISALARGLRTSRSQVYRLLDRHGLVSGGEGTDD